MRQLLGTAIVAASGVLACSANAELIEWTTGDLGFNVIGAGGDYLVFPSLFEPSVMEPAEVEVKYGLWNSPDVPVSVYVNDTFVGSFIADNGYISPGPEFVTFDATGLLVDGDNVVRFSSEATGGDYVVGQVWVRYDGVPAPGVLAPLAAALAFAGRRRR